jgi:hypothetical protein
MAWVDKITYRGKEIHALNFANLNKADVILATREAGSMIQSGPEGSCLTLTDVAGVTFDGEVVKAFKAMAEGNKDYVRAGALINIAGLQKVIYTGIVIFTKRNLQIFDTREAALEWLATQ